MRPAADPPGRAVLVVLIPLILLTLAGAVATLSWPFFWDHGIFAWIGDTIVRGGLPYRDAWDVKGPLSFAAFALTEALFGRGMWGIRLLDLVAVGAAGFAASRMVQRMCGRTAAWLVGVGLVLHHISLGYVDSAQPDGWVAFGLTGAVALLVTPPGAASLRRLAAAGLAIGAAALVKPHYLGFLVLPGLAIMAESSEGSRPAWMRPAILTLAAVVPLALLIAWFGLRGATAHLIDSYVLFNLEAAGEESHSLLRLARAIWHHFAQPEWIAASAAGAVGLGVLVRRRANEAVLLGAWLVTAFGAVIMQGRFYGYHWHLVAWPLGILAGVGLAACWRADRWQRAARVAASVVALVMLLPSVTWTTDSVWHWSRWRLGRESDAAYWSRFDWSQPAFEMQVMLEVSRFVAARTRPADRVLAWNSPMVNYLSERQTPSRFSTGIPFSPRHGGRSPSPRRLAYRAEFLAALTTRPPALVVVDEKSLRHEPLDRWGGPRWSNIPTRFPELAAWLEARYRPDTTIGFYQVYVPR